MIKYNDNTINKWYHDGELIKVYYHGAVVFYKFDSEQGGYKVCYAVVDDITQYSDTEFEDVFNKADGKWYKLNNLNAYEEYGVYGSGRNVTTYEGKLTIDGDYEYQYSGGSWVNLGEVSGSTATLPDVAFVLNYNAKYYDSSTNSMPYTEGQLNTVNAVKQYGAVVDHSEDGYISVTGNTRFVTTGGTVGIGRNNTQTGCTMTIVSKARATSGEAVLTSRGGTSVNQMNWMWRYRTDGIFLHGSSSYNTKKYSVDTTTSPIIASVKTYYDGGVKQILKDWTNNGGYSGNFGYGSSYNGGSMFCDYLAYNSEFWQGDFYWVYMSQEVLTDEQIQQVIDYNEGGGGEPEYPKYYDEIQDPPDNLVFSSMAEAEAYECPWVGMKATIAGDKYIFSGDSQSGYEWVYNPSRLPVGYTEVEYIENVTPNKAYIDTGFKPNQNTKVIADFQYVTTNKHPRCFGCGPWNGLAYELNAENGITSSGVWNWKFGNTSGWLTTGVNTDFNRHTAIIDSGKLYLDDTVIGSTTVTTFQLTDNIGLFGFIVNGSQGGTTQGEYMFGKFYSFKVYDNGTLARDFVTCKRDSDDKYGMYDIVNDVFYVSPNGDNFIGGDTV